MIQERNAKELGSVTKALRQEPIFLTRSRIAGGMIMDAEKGGSVHED